MGVISHSLAGGMARYNCTKMAHFEAGGTVIHFKMMSFLVQLALCGRIFLVNGTYWSLAWMTLKKTLKLFSKKKVNANLKLKYINWFWALFTSCVICYATYLEWDRKVHFLSDLTQVPPWSGTILHKTILEKKVISYQVISDVLMVFLKKNIHMIIRLIFSNYENRID